MWYVHRFQNTTRHEGAAWLTHQFLPFQHTPHNHNLIQVELFDFYAPLYDQHMKEGLLYTAPRILRQEVRQVYNRTLLQQSECVN